MWIQASKTPDRVEDKCSYTEDVLLAQCGVVWNAFLCTFLILVLVSKHRIPSWFDFTAQKLLMIVLKWMGARFEDWLNTCMDQEDSLGFEWPSSFYIQKRQNATNLHLHYFLLPLLNTDLFKAYHQVWKFDLFLQKIKDQEKKKAARALQDQEIKIKILLRHTNIYIHVHSSI